MAILEKAFTYPRDKLLRLFSLGSGYLLQDLILAVKLVNAGFSQLHFILADPINENRDFEINKTTFNYTLKRLKEIYGQHVQISTEFQSTFDNESIDIAYAIDFDALKLNGKDYSARQLRKREGKFSDENYKNIITILKILLNASFSALSVGHELLLFDKNTISTQLRDYCSLDKLIQKYPVPSIKNVYFNSDILHFLMNLHYITNTDCAVFINNSIVKPEDKRLIDDLLKKYQKNCLFLDESVALQMIQTKGNCLVADYNVFSFAKKELPVTSEYEKFKNLYIVRLDWLQREKKHDEYTVLYKENPDKAEINLQLDLLARERQLHARTELIKNSDIQAIQKICEQKNCYLFVNTEKFILGKEDTLLLDRRAFTFLTETDLYINPDEGSVAKKKICLKIQLFDGSQL